MADNKENSATPPRLAGGIAGEVRLSPPSAVRRALDGKRAGMAAEHQSRAGSMEFAGEFPAGRFSAVERGISTGSCNPRRPGTESVRIERISTGYPRRPGSESERNEHMSPETTRTERFSTASANPPRPGTESARNERIGPKFYDRGRVSPNFGEIVRFSSKSGDAARFSSKSGVPARFSSKPGDPGRLRTDSSVRGRFSTDSIDQGHFSTESGDQGHFSNKSGEKGCCRADSSRPGRLNIESGDHGRFSNESGDQGRFSKKSGDNGCFSTDSSHPGRLSIDSIGHGHFSYESGDHGRFSTKSGDPGRHSTEPGFPGRHSTKSSDPGRFSNKSGDNGRFSTRFFEDNLCISKILCDPVRIKKNSRDPLSISKNSNAPCHTSIKSAATLRISSEDPVSVSKKSIDRPVSVSKKSIDPPVSVSKKSVEPRCISTGSPDPVHNNITSAKPRSVSMESVDGRIKHINTEPADHQHINTHMAVPQRALFTTEPDTPTMHMSTTAVSGSAPAMFTDPAKLPAVLEVHRFESIHGIKEYINLTTELFSRLASAGISYVDLQSVPISALEKCFGDLDPVCGHSISLAKSGCSSFKVYHCCQCERKFSDAENHTQHMMKVHVNSLSQEEKNVIPDSIKNGWFEDDWSPLSNSNISGSNIAGADCKSILKQIGGLLKRLIESGALAETHRCSLFELAFDGIKSLSDQTGKPLLLQIDSSKFLRHLQYSDLCAVLQLLVELEKCCYVNRKPAERFVASVCSEESMITLTVDKETLLVMRESLEALVDWVFRKSNRNYRIVWNKMLEQSQKILDMIVTEFGLLQHFCQEKIKLQSAQSSQLEILRVDACIMQAQTSVNNLQKIMSSIALFDHTIVIEEMVRSLLQRRFEDRMADLASHDLPQVVSATDVMGLSKVSAATTAKALKPSNRTTTGSPCSSARVLQPRIDNNIVSADAPSTLDMAGTVTNVSTSAVPLEPRRESSSAATKSNSVRTSNPASDSNSSWTSSFEFKMNAKHVKNPKSSARASPPITRARGKINVKHHEERITPGFGSPPITRARAKIRSSIISNQKTTMTCAPGSQAQENERTVYVPKKKKRSFYVPKKKIWFQYQFSKGDNIFNC